MTSKTWLQIGGSPNAELERSLSERVAAKRAAGKFTWDNEEYLRKISLSVIKDGRDISPQLLEKFRRLCQLHNVYLIPPKITSHRKFIGPVIVAAKKIVYRILEPMLDATIRQQRDFNAAAIYFLAELSKEQGKQKAE